MGKAILEGFEMKKLTAATMLFLLAAFAQMANGAQSAGEIEQAIKALENRYAEAVRRQDVAALEELLAEDFMATSSRAEMRDRAAEVADVKGSPDFVLEAFDLDDMKVRSYGDAAVATGRSILKVKYRGQSNTSEFRFTRVYVRRNGKWQVVAQQLTRLPQK
jgi:ketosteroid isomerase-like protein